MEQLKNDFYSKMEKQHEINQSLTQLLENLSDKFHGLDARIRYLEGLMPVDRVRDTNVKTPNKYQELKKISKTFASSTTFYGITRIMKAESLSTKRMWTLMTLLSLTAGLYIIGKTMGDYYLYDVFTHTKRIHPKSNLLPSVSFCSNTDLENISAIINKAEYVSTESSTILIGVDYFEESLAYGANSHYHCISFNNYRIHTAEHGPFFSAHPAHDILNFEINLTVPFGHLNIFLTDNYLNVLDWSYFVTGFGNNNRGKYYIDFTKSIEHKLEEPYNDCNLIADETYRHDNCLVQCRDSKALFKHNCTLRNYYSSAGYDYCDLPISESFHFDADCQKQCPKECVQTKFNAIISNFVTPKTQEDSLVLSIAYTESSYFEISQTTKINGFSLISNIGGALGLFIGIRFLSLVELLEYLIELFFVLYH